MGTSADQKVGQCLPSAENRKDREKQQVKVFALEVMNDDGFITL